MSMRFTHFQVTFQQTNVHLFVILFMKFSLQVRHSTKSNIRSQLLFNLAKHLINWKLQGWHEARLWVSNRAVQLLFQHGVGLGYYSNTATGSVTIPTWQRALLLFQHGVGLDRTLPGGGGVLPIMAYTGRLRPKGVPFSGFRYKKG